MKGKGLYKLVRTRYLMRVIEDNSPEGQLFRVVFNQPKGVSNREWHRRWRRAFRVVYGGRNEN